MADLGSVNGPRAALRRMLPRDRGVVVQVGSALAHRGIPLQSAYCSDKHARWGFHESLLTELALLSAAAAVTFAVGDLWEGTP
jgi:NADP-dependent 3-hydroxy acid dehydrogenase YdfG